MKLLSRYGWSEERWYALSRAERARHLAVDIAENALALMWEYDRPKKKK